MPAPEMRSNRLREVLRRIAAQPLEVQERAADVLEGLLESSIWLQGLPPNVVHTILRTAGPCARRLSKLCRHIHGALDGLVTLDGVHTPQQLASLLAPHPSRFHHATSLRLTARNPPRDEPEPPPARLDNAFLAALSAAFPKLQSLAFTEACRTLGPDLAHLTPLSPTLTSLVLPPPLDSSLLGAALSLRPLTNLAALTFDLGPVTDVRSALPELARLPRLRSLEMWDHRAHYPACLAPACACCASDLLPALYGLSLTRLSIHMCLHRWDAAAVQALATALPQLESLHLKPDFVRDDSAHAADARARPAVLGALAGRTALTSLRMELAPLGAGADLACLSTLAALKALHVVASNGTYDDPDDRRDASEPEARQLEALLRTAAACWALTSLRVSGHEWHSIPVGLSGSGLSSLVSLSDSLEVLHLAAEVSTAFVPALARLTRLRELRLEHFQVDGSVSPPDLWPDLAQLTALRVLAVLDDRVGLARCFLRHASGMTQLRELTLGVNARCDDDEAFCDLDLMRLGCLHRNLTRLALDQVDSLDVWGPGLCVVTRLTGLRHLGLHHLSRTTYERLHEQLLPLPPSLRRLHMEHWLVGGKVQLDASLLAAAAAQDCAVREGVWFVERHHD